MSQPNVEGRSESIEIYGLGRVAIRREMNRLLLNRDCFLEIGQVRELTTKGVPKVIETRGLVRVIIWGETDGLLQSRDPLMKISNATIMPPDLGIDGGELTRLLKHLHL